VFQNAAFPSFVTVTYSRAGTKISTIAFIFHFYWHFVSDSKASLGGFRIIFSFVEVTYSRAGTIWVTIDFIFTFLAFCEGQQSLIMRFGRILDWHFELFVSRFLYYSFHDFCIIRFCNLRMIVDERDVFQDDIAVSG
jgi:hypothetical protein